MGALAKRGQADGGYTTAERDLDGEKKICDIKKEGEEEKMEKK